MTELENKINRILFSYERSEAVKRIADLIGQVGEERDYYWRGILSKHGIYVA